MTEFSLSIHTERKCRVKKKQQVAICKPKKEALPEIKITITLILDF
jgi:hypothetical protein